MAASSDDVISFDNFIKSNNVILQNDSPVGIAKDEVKIDPRVGIAIVIGVESPHGPQGTSKDVEEISRVFGELNFLVWLIHNPTVVDLDHVMTSVNEPKKLPPEYKYTVVYYAGHGGTDEESGHKYIKPYAKPGTAEEKYFIQDKIIAKFTDKDRHHLFFFDCCLSVSSSTGSTAKASDAALYIPAGGTYLVAFATSHGQKSSGDTFHGGKWTENLCINLKTYDLPITTILDKTWNDLDELSKSYYVNQSVQRPHYISSVGLLSLRDNRHNYFKGFIERSKRSISNKRVLSSDTKKQNDGVSEVLRKRPKIYHLKKAMEETDIEKNGDDWQWFGKLLVGEKKLKKYLHQRCNFERFLERTLEDRPNMSWQDVVDALTQPTDDGKGYPVGGQDKEYDKKLREYLVRKEIRYVYGKEPDADP